MPGHLSIDDAPSGKPDRTSEGLPLSDRVVLITGSTTGIGAATARLCADQGALVMVHGRDEPRAAAVCKALGARSSYVVADLADPAAPERLISATTERFGRIDALVNNAALTTRGNLQNTDLALFDRLVAVNVRAPLFLIQHALPHFRRLGRGVVVNIGSVNAYCGEPNLVAYSITKGALTTLTRNLADALAAEHVRINQINVGWTITDNERTLKEAEGLPSGWELQLPSAYAPSGRIFYPEEVARHIVFWLSDLAGPVSGTVFELEQYPIIGRNPNKEMPAS